MLQVCLHVFTKIDKHGSICAEIKQIKAFKLSYFEVLQWNNFIYFCPFRSIPLENYMFIAVLKCSQSNFFCFLFTLRTFQHSLYNEIVCFILFLSVCGNTVMSMYVPLHSTWDLILNWTSHYSMLSFIIEKDLLKVDDKHGSSSSSNTKNNRNVL